MTVRAWTHLHTEASRDADLTHEQVRRAAVSRGIAVVFLTEHQEALRAGEAGEAAARCRALSDDRVLLVPGLEVASDERYHVLGLGLAEPVEAGPAVKVADRMRAAGAYPVLAHPGRYRSGWEAALPRIGAVEVWNRHYDGRVSPSRDALRGWRAAGGARAVFGLDAHGAETLSGPSPELLLDPAELTEPHAVTALREGRFETALAGKPFLPAGGGGAGLRSWAGEAWRRARRAARRISLVLPISAEARRRWGRRW